MTAVTAALVIVLANQGYWFADAPGVIEVRWAVEETAPPGELSWRLELDGACLAEGRVLVDNARTPTRVELTPPKVRTRTTMFWTYCFRNQEDGALIAEGREELRVFPRDTLFGVSRRIEGRRLVICGASDAMLSVLKTAEISYTAIGPGDEALAALQNARADIVIVGEGQLSDSSFGQTALLGQAEQGASVLLLMQSKPRRLAGYGLLRRARPTTAAWRKEHALFAGFDVHDLQSWLGLSREDVWAVQLPADEPALELAYWPLGATGDEPPPIDALLVEKRIGKGRLILCQLPLGPWGEDPRSQIFLRNALNHMITRPEPTPPPSRRRTASSSEHAQRGARKASGDLK